MAARHLRERRAERLVNHNPPEKQQYDKAKHRRYEVPLNLSVNQLSSDFVASASLTIPRRRPMCFDREFSDLELLPAALVDRSCDNTVWASSRLGVLAAFCGSP